MVDLVPEKDDTVVPYLREYNHLLIGKHKGFTLLEFMANDQ